MYNLTTIGQKESNSANLDRYPTIPIVGCMSNLTTKPFNYINLNTFFQFSNRKHNNINTTSYSGNRLI